MSREPHQDRDLAKLFAAQRQADRELAPEFEPLIRRPHWGGARPATRRLGLAMATALLLIASLRLIWRPAATSPAKVDFALTTELDPSWSAPSDFLLRSPIESSLELEPHWNTDFLESFDPADFLENTTQSTDRSRRTMS